MINPRIRRAVRLALASSATIGTAFSGTALAQEAQEAAPAAELGTVIVTGSRIPQPNLTSISPVTAVSSDEVKLAGVTRVEDLVNNLPQAFADFGANISNGATGAATVNLRGLGAQRTLVLVNSRRLMPGDPTQNGNATADLNQIPTSLVERVEVLTGGASAVYGADAVAGVVNFIMNDHFEGVRLDAQYSFYQHNNSNSEVAGLVADHGFKNPDSNVMDGYTTDATFVLGLNRGDGRGNATVYAGYRNVDALLQSERDYSACTLNSGDDFSCGGSSTASPARFQAVDQDPLSPTFQGETGPALTLDANGALRPFTAADQYNFGPLNYYQRPDDRYTAGLFAHYDFNEHSTAYTEFMFMNDQSIAQIAPSGLFRGGGAANGQYIVNCDNPFMTAEQVQTFCTDQGLAATDDTLISIGKRNAEGGGRADHLEHTSYRAVIGARGSFSDAWSYDVYGLYGTTDFQRTYLNDFSVRRVGNAPYNDDRARSSPRICSAGEGRPARCRPCRADRRAGAANRRAPDDPLRTSRRALPVVAWTERRRPHRRALALSRYPAGRSSGVCAPRDPAMWRCPGAREAGRAARSDPVRSWRHSGDWDGVQLSAFSSRLMDHLLPISPFHGAAQEGVHMFRVMRPSAVDTHCLHRPRASEQDLGSIWRGQLQIRNAEFVTARRAIAHAIDVERELRALPLSLGVGQDVDIGVVRDCVTILENDAAALAEIDGLGRGERTEKQCNQSTDPSILAGGRSSMPLVPVKGMITALRDCHMPP